MPSLERIDSVVDVDATLQLLSQAYEIIFKELARFVEFAQRFDGISWKVYVRLMNRFRKTGTYFKVEDPEGGILSQPLVNVVPEPAADEYGEEEYGREEDNYGAEEYEGGE